MSEPSADRYADPAPLIPAWAGPVYLVVSLVAAIAYLGFSAFVVSMPGLALTKALGVVLLGIYAVLNRVPLLALALFLSSAGDYALAMRPPQTEAGIAFFAAAHVGYIVIFALAVVRRGFRADGLILAIALAAYGAAMYLWLSPGMGELRGFASVYLGVILVMAAAAGFARAPRLITLGALLFVISDSILAARWFRGEFVADPAVLGGFDWGGSLVWITYYAAQIALAVGIVRMKQEDGARA